MGGDFRPTLTVWRNTIFEKSSSTTDKYTKNEKGKFNKDFNTSLMLLMYDESFTRKIDGIKSNREIVQGLMKDLQNPPKKYKDAYDALNNFYDSYMELTNLAVGPSGSLESYTDGINNADTKSVNCYDKVKLYLED